MRDLEDVELVVLSDELMDGKLGVRLERNGLIGESERGAICNDRG